MKNGPFFSLLEIVVEKEIPLIPVESQPRKLADTALNLRLIQTIDRKIFFKESQNNKHLQFAIKASNQVTRLSTQYQPVISSHMIEIKGGYNSKRWRLEKHKHAFIN